MIDKSYVSEGVNTVIDTGTYFVVSYLLHKITSEVSPVKIGDVLSYAVSDFMIRRNWIPDMSWIKFSDKEHTRRNILINVYCFAIASLVDIVVYKQSLGKSIVSNAIRNGLNTPAGILVDSAIGEF